MPAPIPVIIPALEPDERFLQLLEQLQKQAPGPVVVVDDGSGPAYAGYFAAAKEQYGAAVLTHEVNRGKGRALKTAFAYCLAQWPDSPGCVTADSDGQHTPACIAKCAAALRAQPDHLVLGVRDFDSGNVPFNSRFGNKLTCLVLRAAGGVAVHDTQTGLRGIPAGFMHTLLAAPGERFEFETEMLLQTKTAGVPIAEVPIETVYDSKTAHSTHFHPVRDSWRIYKLIGARMARFLVSSLSASVVDLALFALLCALLRGRMAPALYPAAATVGARIVSAVYNYCVNYFWVFASGQRHRRSGPRYLLLAVVQMAASAALTTGGLALLPGAPELAVKIPVDVALFFLSYRIQQRFVY